VTRFNLIGHTQHGIQILPYSHFFHGWPRCGCIYVCGVTCKPCWITCRNCRSDGRLIDCTDCACLYKF